MRYLSPSAPVARPRARTCTKRVRRAMASLELVLVFPMLMGIVSVLFVIAQSDAAKVGMATAARRQTWAKRSQAPAGSPLSVSYDPMTSKIDSAPQNTVSLGPVFARRTLQAQSRNTLIANPWAFAAIPFPSLDQNVIPHTTVLSSIEGIGVVASDICTLMELSYPNGPVLNPASYVIEPVNYGLLAAGGVLLVVPYAGWNLFAAALGRPGF
jgi:hypothetical protein